MNTHRRLSLFLLLIAFVFQIGLGQPRRADFNRPQTFDLQHYAIGISFDHAKRTVFGDTTIELLPLNDGLRLVELDARDLRFESVTLDRSGTALTYKVSPGKVTVSLDRAYKKDEKVAIRFKYSAKPKKGVYFVDEKRDKNRVVHSSQIWTQGEPDEAHHWFPSFDFPSDKATTEKFVTVEKGFQVIGNGALISESESTDGKNVTFHYKMDIPHPTYLVSFVVGKYEKFHDKFRDISLTNYLYPGTGILNQNAYSKTKQMLEIHEKLTGVNYPFNKYDQTVVANFQFGGMENITATTMADSEIAYANLDFLRGNVEDLVAHEIAHSWFGNNVTMKNWAELWLNEAFATFMEAKVREELYGRQEYLRKIGVDAESFMTHDAAVPNSHALFNQKANDISILFKWPAVTYNKGGAVVHMLRSQIGDEAFWKAINFYLTRHRFGSVETADLMKVMEETSGQKLDWFFDQWVYGTSYPKLTIKQGYDEKAKVLRFEITQTQRGDKLTPQAFRLPLEIEITTPGERPRRETLEINARKQSFEIASPAKPSSVTFDPDTKIPLLATKLN